MQQAPWISPRLKIGMTLLAGVILFGTIGFTLIEGWTPIEALYTTVLIISTLGFADLRPEDTAGKFLTMLLIAGGVGTLYYLVSALAQTVIETQFDRGKRRAMDQQINRLADHFIVCGFGRVGREACQQLKKQGQAFVVIDADSSRIDRIQALGYLHVIGDASDDQVLIQAGISRARTLLTAVQGDAGNVYITLSARALNPHVFIVARAATAEAEHKLRIAGANRVISPYIMGGRGMAITALRPAVMELMDLLVHSDDLGIWLEERIITPDSALAGKQLGEALQSELAGQIILAISHAGTSIRANPPNETMLQAGDVLVLLMKLPPDNM
jgi:voltage-gated potassium channel